MLASFGGGLGRIITNYVAYLVASSKSTTLFANYVFYSQAAIAFAYVIVVGVGMKDVVNEKEFDMRRERSGSINT